jgi:hypothetical protein
VSAGRGLDDWEWHHLAEIERELSSDRWLVREMAALSRPQQPPGFWRRCYPAGYLMAAVTYMLLSMTGDAARSLGWTMVVLLAIWACDQMRRARRERSGTAQSLALGADS